MNKPISRTLILAAVAAVLVFTGIRIYARIAALRPPVILITAHSLRPDHLSCYGYDRLRTDGIDSLAQKGAIFENTYTNVPSSAHGYASIMSGKAGSLAVDLKVKALSEYLKGRGYTTALIASDASILPAFDPRTAGFDVFESVADKAKPDKRLSADRDVTERALETIQALKKTRKPLFVWISYALPRYPYRLPEDFSKNRDDFPYDRQILLLDEQVSKLLEGLRRLRLDKKAIFIFTSATGESLGEHKEPEHGIFIYNAVVKVPLIIRLPRGIPAPKIQSPASHADILPTVLDALKIPHGRDETGGESLVPVLLRKQKRERPIYLESVEGRRIFGWSPLAGIVSGGYKYIEAPAPELYNLADDPYELNNIIAREPKKAADLRDALMKFIGRNRPGMAAIMSQGADPKDVIDILAPYTIATRTYGDRNSYFLTGIYERLLEKDPKNKALRYALARFYLRDSQFFSAEKMLLGLNEDYPDFDLGWQLLGEAYNAQNKEDDAIISFEKAISLNPDLPASLNNAAWLYAKKGEKLDAALRYAQRAAELVRNDPSFLDTLAEVHYRMGDTGKALEILRQAAALDKNSEYLQKRLKEMEGGRASPSKHTQ